MLKPINPIIQQLYKKVETPGFKFYCVGCNRERRHATPTKVGSAAFFAQIAITTSFLSMLTWPWLHFKGLFAFVIPVGLVMEALSRMKARAALVCPDCSFDPILYLSNRDKAVRQVEASWRKKFEEKGLSYPVPAKSPRRKEEILTSI